jgi:hypothetical protein
MDVKAPRVASSIQESSIKHGRALVRTPDPVTQFNPNSNPVPDSNHCWFEVRLNTDLFIYLRTWVQQPFIYLDYNRELIRMGI